MEFEPGNGLGPADELRLAKIAARRESADHKLGNRGWWGWRVGWRLAKMAVMDVEKEVQEFAVPWTEAWARVEAIAWAEAKARLTERGRWSEEEKQGAAAALLLAEGLGEARAQARGERVPDRLADPRTIADILTSLIRSHIARDLWDDSVGKRDFGCIIQFIVPINRLPIELLHQIFLAIIEESSGPPSVLMLVCKQWHSIITSIWASLNLGTTTPIDAVTRKLERNQWLLDIEIGRAHV